jgi:hypothetical protein
MSMRYLIPLLLLALAGCASTPNANYSAYIEAGAREQQQKAAQLASLADASHCKDDRCVENTKAFAALVAVASGAVGGSRIAPPPRELHWTEKAAALSSALAPWGGFAVQINGQNTTRDMSLSRDRAQVDMFGAVANGWRQSSQDAFAAFGMQAPTTQIIAGRDYVPGQIGDNAGRDQIGGNQHTGDWRTGDNIARDTIGGDRIDTDYGTGNRLDSAGPYRDIGNGPRCEGAQCQQVAPPESEQEDGELWPRRSRASAAGASRKTCATWLPTSCAPRSTAPCWSLSVKARSRCAPLGATWTRSRSPACCRSHWALFPALRMNDLHMRNLHALAALPLRTADQ